MFDESNQAEQMCLLKSIFQLLVVDFWGEGVGCFNYFNISTILNKQENYTLSMPKTLTKQMYRSKQATNKYTLCAQDANTK